MSFFGKLKEISKMAKENESMKNHTSFKIGGCADFMVFPKTQEEIKAVISLCKNEGIEYTVMGNGSNMLVSDKGIKGVIIKISEGMSEVTISSDEIMAYSGVLLSTLAHKALENSLEGLEFASGIPGTLGGAVVMNAGAYGGEIKDVITHVGYMDKDGNIFEVTNEQSEFGYRTSLFSKNDYIVLYAKLKLKLGNKDMIKEKMRDLNQRRRDKQPLNLPSAGSAFKRPEGYFAGKLIEDAGLKGFSIGGAKVSEKHSGFIVNFNDATAKDVLELIEYVQKTVEKRFGVKLEPEVKFYGR